MYPCLHCKNLTSFDQFTDLVNHYVAYHREEYREKLRRNNAS